MPVAKNFTFNVLKEHVAMRSTHSKVRNVSVHIFERCSFSPLTSRAVEEIKVFTVLMHLYLWIISQIIEEFRIVYIWKTFVSFCSQLDFNCGLVDYLFIWIWCLINNGSELFVRFSKLISSKRLLRSMLGIVLRLSSFYERPIFTNALIRVTMWNPWCTGLWFLWDIYFLITII